MILMQLDIVITIKILYYNSISHEHGIEDVSRITVVFPYFFLSSQQVAAGPVAVAVIFEQLFNTMRLGVSLAKTPANVSNTNCSNHNHQKQDRKNSCVLSLCAKPFANFFFKSLFVYETICFAWS